MQKEINFGWATDAIVYDEQPTTFGQSWTQRVRWTVGHIQCFKFYTKDLAKGVVENKTLMNFDGLLYIMCIPLFIVSLLLMVLNVVLYLLKEMTFKLMMIRLFGFAVLGYLLLVFTAVATLLLDKRPIKSMIKGIILYPIFMASWVVINFVSFFKKDVKWDKIEHGKKESEV